jgi:hypothetical protein
MKKFLKNKIKGSMQSLTTNLSSLNNVYGGMLSAMGKKRVISFEPYKTKPIWQEEN